MRRLFGCPDIVSLTEKFLIARNFFRIFTENNPVMWDSKTFCIPEVKGLSVNKTISFQFSMFTSLDSIASVVGIFMYLTISKFKQVLRSRKGLGKVLTTTLVWA